jgi:branched-chain amino acid aminotransferase
MGLSVEERMISIDEIMAAYNDGQLHEVFGTGTAATISPIKELKYKDDVMEFQVESWKTAPELKKRLNGIREGKLPDTYGWMNRV